MSNIEENITIKSMEKHIEKGHHVIIEFNIPCGSEFGQISTAKCVTCLDKFMNERKQEKKDGRINQD